MLVDLRRRQLGADYSPVDNQSFSLRHLQESAPREPFVDEFPGEFRDWSVNHLVFNALNLPVQTDFLEPPGYTLVSFPPLLSARLFMLPFPCPCPCPKPESLRITSFSQTLSSTQKTLHGLPVNFCRGGTLRPQSTPHLGFITTQWGQRGQRSPGRKSGFSPVPMATPHHQLSTRLHVVDTRMWNVPITRSPRPRDLRLSLSVLGQHCMFCPPHLPYADTPLPGA